MVEQGAAVTGEFVSYSYRASLLGAPREFSLTSRGLEWVIGGSSANIPLDRIRRLRMSYRPGSMQGYRFVTEVWAEGFPKLQIVSTSTKSMFEHERLDRAYSAFVTELHRRISLANPSVQFERGSNPFIYWPGAVVFVGVGIGLAALIVRGLQEGSAIGAAFVAGFLALFLWQSGNFFRRNRPGSYRPDSIPADVMPRK